MKQSFLRKWLVAGVLVWLQGLSAPAQNGPTNTPAPSESATPPTPSSASTKLVTVNAGPSAPTQPGAKSPTPYPAGIEETLTMLQAGVSKDVVKTYIETAQVASPLSAADIVMLKEHGVPDDVTVALIKRGAELAAQANQPGTGTPAPAKVTGTTSLDALVAALRRGQLNPGYLDPEGYDYFRY